MIVVICGPTASGKSKLAIRLAQDFNGEIINGDAFQVYKELEIGTAKPTKEELMMATHHLFDYVEPTKNHSVMDYQVEARKTINEILSRKKLVVIVGGTGLYQKASLYDYTFTEEKENVDLSDLASLNNEELYNYLVSLDEKASLKIHPNNRKRVLRAIAIIRQTGFKKSEIEDAQEHKMIYEDVHFVGLNINREELYKKINNRVDSMFEEGLVEEVTSLYEKYDFSNNAFKGIGYKEFIPYFEGKNSLEETKELIKKNTRNYAKRQFTFFKHQMPTIWCDSIEEAYNYVKGLVNKDD